MQSEAQAIQVAQQTQEPMPPGVAARAAATAEPTEESPPKPDEVPDEPEDPQARAAREAAEQREAAARQEAAALRTAQLRLHRRFDGGAGPAAVDRALETAVRRFDGSRIRTFIPILAERLAAEDLATAGGTPFADPPAPGPTPPER
ncbi:three-helix bundle dimerization domain-containing protein [Kitasatospora sp. NPDC059571]|uniref:three-helix bundle dimerization domain-containing protein n=1 Tax=Kitasatospora sp. NPDC059571 TaxID=3346871 RepID=UPI0036C8CF75